MDPKPTPGAKTTGYNLILKKLLTGNYSCIARRPSGYRKSVWCIYSGKMNPVGYISRKQFLALSEMLKEDKNKIHMLDLRKVRSLHGNCWLKKLYKQQLKLRQDGEA